MKKNILPIYIISLDILHICILFFTYIGGIYAFITGNLILQTIHFAHILLVSIMILSLGRCVLTDYTNIYVEKNGKSRKEFSDFTQYIFYTIFRVKFSPKILGKLNESAVILGVILFTIALYKNFLI